MKATPGIFLILIGYSLIGIGCNSVPKQDLRDAVIRNYFTMIDSSGIYDTTDIHFKTLKAYVQNDTTTLKKLDSFIYKKENDRNNWELWTKDIPLPELKKLQATQAYRFIFSINGSSGFEAITVSERDTVYKLDYLFYTHDMRGSKINQARSFGKQISKTQWGTILDKISDADFWELNNISDQRGFDGNDLTVFGYVRSGDSEKSKYVHRWTRTTLNDAFYFIYYKMLDKKERMF
jgi:hypothetical protein